ncbi:hypothetical protein DPMN_032372 [Dreissena polymorpha]|uniref:Uncharacterized protein n=1 Tax=Dreissena polymorpha TaxID=45954 RepID=A0A9D4M425_DREPO|nr:hypothetical protein DPMN_032372 [Dreissena polymorpha]
MTQPISPEISKIKTKPEIENFHIKLLTKFGEDENYLNKREDTMLNVKKRTNNAHIQLLTKFGKAHIQLLTKFGEDRMKTTLNERADNMLNIQLLTKFGEDRMKTT